MAREKETKVSISFTPTKLIPIPPPFANNTCVVSFIFLWLCYCNFPSPNSMVY